MAISRTNLGKLSPAARAEVNRQLGDDNGALTKAKQLGKPRSKYRNVRAEGWDSQAERRYYDVLLLREKAGEISNLRRQVRVDLHIGQRYMRIDFVYEEDGETIYDDYKGFPTPAWKIKADIWAAGIGPGILRITRKVSGGYHRTDIHPKPSPELLKRILAAHAGREAK